MGKKRACRVKLSPRQNERFLIGNYSGVVVSNGFCSHFRQSVVQTLSLQNAIVKNSLLFFRTICPDQLQKEKMVLRDLPDRRIRRRDRRYHFRQGTSRDVRAPVFSWNSNPPNAAP